VGVGIVGVEGTQARRASDYSIAQFRFLARLLLVHGRYNYRRVCLTFVYSFYKNTTMVLTLCAFAPESAFSASSLYDGWMMASFNVFFTFMPVIAHGVFERDISPPLLLAFPQLHTAGMLIIIMLILLC
jgi:magnesium-transporting ATPase (P-type)